MSKNLHAYFVLFHLLVIISREVMTMNETKVLQLIAELHIMDFTNSKPNYADLARKYGMDYRTIKKYHEGYHGKPKSRNKPSKLDEYKVIIIEKFNIPRTSKKGVYEFLVDQYGETSIGSYSNFKAYCNKKNLKPVKRNTSSGGGNTRYETVQGDMAQCDWKENIQMVSKNGEIFVINVFHLILKFSRYSYIELTLSKEQTAVFKCLINGFKFYGGIPKRILFDNMSSVVNTTVKPKRINHKMIQFAKDMNFKIETCKARHAYTKGTNEARNKIMDWIRCYSNEFETLEELQILVDKLNVKMNTNICEGVDMPPCILFLKEKEYLNPLPNNTIVETYLSPGKVQVSAQQLVYYQGVQYSVDKKYINEYVSLEQFEDKLQIYYKGKLIAVHSISKNPINYTKVHYEQTLHKQLGKCENFDEIVAQNLTIMDRLLENRKVSITKEEAIQSYEHMVAYLISYGPQSNWIKRFIQTLNKEERSILYKELSKILPYVDDEEQFFLAFRHAVNKKQLKTLRVNFWGLDIMENYNFLSQDGYDSIYKDFEKETTKYMCEIKESMKD